MQPAEGERERRRDALLLAFVAEVARRLAGCVANGVGIEGVTAIEGIEDGALELRDLLLRHAELRRDFHRRGGGILTDLETEREVMRRQDVRASPSRRQLVNCELRCRGIGRLPSRAGAREERQVRSSATDRS